MVGRDDRRVHDPLLGEGERAQRVDHLRALQQVLDLRLRRTIGLQVLRGGLIGDVPERPTVPVLVQMGAQRRDQRLQEPAVPRVGGGDVPAEALLGPLRGAHLDRRGVPRSPLGEQVRDLDPGEAQLAADPQPSVQPREVQRVAVPVLADPDELHEGTGVSLGGVQRRRPGGREHRGHVHLAGGGEEGADQLPVLLGEHLDVVVGREAVGVEPVRVRDRERRQAVGVDPHQGGALGEHVAAGTGEGDREIEIAGLGLRGRAQIDPQRLPAAGEQQHRLPVQGLEQVRVLAGLGDEIVLVGVLGRGIRDGHATDRVHLREGGGGAGQAQPPLARLLALVQADGELQRQQLVEETGGVDAVERHRLARRLLAEDLLQGIGEHGLHGDSSSSAGRWPRTILSRAPGPLSNNPLPRPRRGPSVGAHREGGDPRSDFLSDM